jgi:hypothetical protein
VRVFESGVGLKEVIPASHLGTLTGLVEWGGDAFADSERLYDDNL